MGVKTKRVFMHANEFVVTFKKVKIEYLGNVCLVVKISFINCGARK